jgi:hypothetical protein
MRIRILLFSSLTFQRCQQKLFFKSFLESSECTHCSLCTGWNLQRSSSQSSTWTSRWIRWRALELQHLTRCRDSPAPGPGTTPSSGTPYRSPARSPHGFLRMRTYVLPSVADPDSALVLGRLNPDRDPGGQKWPTNIEKKVKKFHVLKCWMFSFEGWSLLP